jgi:hypothetical protein
MQDRLHAAAELQSAAPAEGTLLRVAVRLVLYCGTTDSNGVEPHVSGLGLGRNFKARSSGPYHY